MIDDFGDLDFIANPTWAGDDSLFKVNAAAQLQSKATPGTSKDICLVTESGMIHGCEWSFWVRFNLSPSTQNFCRYYLVSNQANLKSPLNGYYVQLGGSTGNTDSISLYKQAGTVRTPIIMGRPSTVSKTNNVVRIRVLRDSSGNWQLFSDTTGKRNYAPEGTCHDETFTVSAFTGFYVKFTSGNVAGYYLDDVYVGGVRVDTVPPKLIGAEALSSRKLRVVFSEDMDAATALNAPNFEIDGGATQADSIMFDAGDHATLAVTVQERFGNGSYHTIRFSGLQDLAGNVMRDTLVAVVYFVPGISDVLISELMPDPSPPHGLPDAEYVELYNHSRFPVSLAGWQITDGTSHGVIPSTVLQPDSMVVLCSVANAPIMSPFCNAIGLAGFPSLNNDADNISLLDGTGQKIDEVCYDLSWYHDITKQEGGWSLELANPFALCKQDDNWHASSDATGGTPGRINTGFINSPETTAPKIKDVAYSDSTVIRIVFDEKMDSLSLTTANITGVNIQRRLVQGRKNDTLQLLTDPMEPNREYVIMLEGVKDCMLNAAKTAAHFLFVPIKKAKQNDIIITEIYPDPKQGNLLPPVEWIELYNRSDHVCWLKNWTIRDLVTTARIPDAAIYPDSFILLCNASDAVALSAYGHACGAPGFPSLNNTEEQLLLSDENGFVIHSVSYKSDWYHNSFKAMEGGWSLEMIDPGNPCGSGDNWKASTDRSGGTPGRINSAYGMNADKKQPYLKRIYPVDTASVVLYFNETLDSGSIVSGATFQPAAFTPVDFSFWTRSLDQLLIHLHDSLEVIKNYEVFVTGIRDCAGNEVVADPTVFGLPVPADSNDIVISEVLFNPKNDGVDFVELFNKSGKYIDLRYYQLANTDDANAVRSISPFGADGWLIKPYDYMVITSDQSLLARDHFIKNPMNVIERADMPSYNDDKGSVVLTNMQGDRLDEFDYDEKMHFPLLDDREGVSLERLDVARPTNERTNWTSASTGCGYATPTFRNSQQQNSVHSSASLSIEPAVFSPDGDGYNDVVNFSYHFSKPGYMGRLQVYDASGRLVRTLHPSEMLGNDGVYTWNGTTDAGSLAPMGIYIVYFEVFNLQGDAESYIKTVVVAMKL